MSLDDEHVSSIRNKLRTIPESGAYAFAVACAERLLPVYSLAAVEAGSGHRVMRNVLDAIWEWLSRGMMSPLAGYSAQCEALIPADTTSTLSNIAAEVVIAVAALASLIENRRSGDVMYAADSNIRFLEGFLHEYLRIQIVAEANPVVFAHPLMKAEMFRQGSDLDDLAAQPAGDGIGLVRSRSMNVSILDNVWFRSS